MKPHWQEILKDRLQLFGHRNWLVIADSAYPAQSSRGIETIVADEDQATALEKTIAILDECRHIKAKIYTDRELSFVYESDAPGIGAYRKQLSQLFNGHENQALPHEEIITRLDKVGETFRVLLIKTKMRLPYTSVFFELECGYWTAQAEDRLRVAMSSKARDGALSVAEGVTH